MPETLEQLATRVDVDEVFIKKIASELFDAVTAKDVDRKKLFKKIPEMRVVGPLEGFGAKFDQKFRIEFISTACGKEHDVKIYDADTLRLLDSYTITLACSPDGIGRSTHDYNPKSTVIPATTTHLLIVVCCEDYCIIGPIINIAPGVFVPPNTGPGNLPSAKPA